jgi:hypothetical protein
MPDRQGLLVSAQFISPPSGIHEFRGLARFDGQVAVPFIRLKRRKKIAPSSWPDAKDHAPAFIGADRAIPNHLSEHIVGVVHDRLETRGSIVARRRKHNDQASLQEAALKAGGCQVIRAEKWSGTTTEGREALRTVWEFLHAGDVLMVTHIDRLARSIGDLQDIVRTVRARGVSLKATEQPIDTTPNV